MQPDAPRPEPLIATATTPRGDLRFFCPPNAPAARKRADTALTKEPETIEWLETIGTHCVLYDIGANVGVYTLYAAAAGATVYAFEPAPDNYAILTRNVHINEFAPRVRALPLGLGERTAIETLFIADPSPGKAQANIGTPVNAHGESFNPGLATACPVFTLDRFIDFYNAPSPTHIKIDVDGLEHSIVRGAERPLANPALRSISIELDDRRPHEVEEVTARMNAAGLTLFSKRHNPNLDGTRHSTIYNHRFDRP
jgi:FkbM family methyltransferase